LHRAHHLVKKVKLHKVVICNLHLLNWGFRVFQHFLYEVPRLNFVQ
jgi:hypothetical protein